MRADCEERAGYAGAECEVVEDRHNAAPVFLWGAAGPDGAGDAETVGRREDGLSHGRSEHAKSMRHSSVRSYRTAAREWRHYRLLTDAAVAGRREQCGTTGAQRSGIPLAAAVAGGISQSAGGH